MRKKVTGTLVVTIIATLFAVARRLGTVDVDEDSDDTENTEKRGLKWGPIMPWWPRR